MHKGDQNFRLNVYTWWWVMNWIWTENVWSSFHIKSTQLWYIWICYSNQENKKTQLDDSKSKKKKGQKKKKKRKKKINKRKKVVHVATTVISWWVDWGPFATMMMGTPNHCLYSNNHCNYYYEFYFYN